MTGQVFFLPHGGGPLPLMDDAGHRDMSKMLRSLQEQVAKSPAIVLITAHWQGECVQLSGAAHPPLLFDYYGFPPETYNYTYPAPGAPDLAKEVEALLSESGIASFIDDDRGFDHGTFVPMMLIRPQSDIKILQMSVLESLDPDAHIAVGKALSPLLETGVTFIGSGLSFHNLKAMLRGQPNKGAEDEAFDIWLNNTLLDETLTKANRENRLVNWTNAPGARFCHPQEEHLMPLHVCFGAASAAGLACENIYRETLMGFMTSAFRWS